MSRNLCRSYCCKNIVRLSDLRGKPIEFRRYASYQPHIGTRWDCPTCKTAYFAWWRDAEYGENEHRFVIDLSYYESFNDEHDTDEKVMAADLGVPADTPIGDIYKEWYARFPNRPLPVRSPENARWVCLDNAEDSQLLWGHDIPEPESK